jgi:hypothetical protein
MSVMPRREPGGDDLLLVAAGDLDAAGLGGLADRDGQGEHAGGVVGGDVAGVGGLAEEDLPGEGAGRAFGAFIWALSACTGARSARTVSTFCSTVNR